MQSANLNLLMLAHGNARDRHSFSGINSGLLTALEVKTGNLIPTVDVELQGARRFQSLLNSFSTSMPRWRQDFRLSELAFKSRSQVADAAILEQQEYVDCLLQMGGQFTCHRTSSIPVFSYHDNISILSKLGGRQSFNYHATPKVQDRFIELEKESLQQNSGLFTLSEKLKSAMIEHYDIPEDKILKVGSGLIIDTSRIPTMMGDEKYNAKNILFVGKDFERKGGYDVVEAFKRVRKKEPSARLHIVGCEPDINIENVVVHGFLNQNTEQGRHRIEELFRTATLFTMPSHFEPFGIPHCEAMYYSTACVGSDVGAIPEIITDGVTGRVCPAGDVEALSEAYLEIISDSLYAETLGIQGYKKAVENFGWDKVAERMLGFMQRNLTGTPGVDVNVSGLIGVMDAVTSRAHYTALNA